MAFPDLIEWARVIDCAAEGGVTEKWVPSTQTKTVSQPSGLEAIAEALEKAATADDQLVLSCGMPLTFNKETGRYSLAPTAALVMKFMQEKDNDKPLVVNMRTSDLFARRNGGKTLTPLSVK